MYTEMLPFTMFLFFCNYADIVLDMKHSRTSAWGTPSFPPERMVHIVQGNRTTLYPSTEQVLEYEGINPQNLQPM